MMSLEACRGYAYSGIVTAIEGCDVEQYQVALNTKVDDKCLEMGGFCQNDKPRFQKLTAEITKEISDLTADEAERDKLFSYANRVINIGRNFLALNRGY